MGKCRWFLSLLLLILPFSISFAFKLTIGTLMYNPPFEVESAKEKTQQFFGFDINLMNEICKRIGADCQYKSMLFKNMPEMLATGQIDLGIGSIYITPERSKMFLFSLPYKTSDVQFVVRKDSGLNHVEELQGKTVGLFESAPTESYVIDRFGNGVTLKTADNSMDLLNLLSTKQVDAVATNTEQAGFWVTSFSEYKVIGMPHPIGLGYGIMTQLGNTDLMKKINAALISMEKDGTYLQIYKESFEN